MRYTILTLSLFLALGVSLNAQDKEGKKTKKITIITVDENGKKKEVTKEISVDDADVEWKTDGEEVRVIVRGSDGEEQDIVVHVPNVSVEMKKGAFLGVYLGESTSSGVSITGTASGSGARKAGLKDGDIISAINGEEVRTVKELGKEIDKHEPGDEIKVTYLRDGKKKTVTATLGVNKESWAYNFPEMEDIVIEVQGDDDFWIEEYDKSDKGFLGVYPAEELDGIDGMMIKETVGGSAAAEAGLQMGDVITKIDDHNITSFDDLKEALSDKKPGDVIKLSYQRQGKTNSTEITLGSRGSKKRVKKVYIKDKD